MKGHAGGENAGRGGAMPDAPFEKVARLVRTAVAGRGDPGAERAGRERFLSRTTRARGRTPLLVGGLVALGGVSALLVVASQHLRPRPAADLGGAVWGGSVVRFSEGTELRFGLDGRGRIAESGPGGARVVLDAGQLVARVVHRPNARWRIEAGPFAVSVKGTKFRVSWQPEPGHFQVAMVEGAVVVEGPAFSQALGPGQTLVATTAGGIVRLGPNDPGDPLELPIASENEPAAASTVSAAHAHVALERGPSLRGEVRHGSRLAFAPTRTRPARPDGELGRTSWSRRLALGGFREVLSQAKAAGIDGVLARRGLDDLTALATAARLSGEVEIARRALAAQRSRFPGTKAASLAAFLLGRLAEESDRNPAAAIAWYDRCLAEASGDLASLALGRQLAVLADSPGKGAEAVASARRYLDRYPEGPHAARARAVLAQPRSP